MMEQEIQKTRQNLMRLRVLLAAATEARTLEWFEGRVPLDDIDKEDRAEATKDLVQLGLVEKDDCYPGSSHPQPYRLTGRGRAFFEDVQRTIWEGNGINWWHINQIEFSIS